MSTILEDAADLAELGTKYRYQRCVGHVAVAIRELESAAKYRPGELSQHVDAFLERAKGAIAELEDVK